MCYLKRPPFEPCREIHRVLKPGGIFIAYHFPNRYSLIELLGRLLSHPYTHPYRFSLGDIRELCRGSGFTAIERRTYAIIPRNMWSRLPESLRNSPALARFVNRLDEALESLLPLLCQNHLFVARAV